MIPIFIGGTGRSGTTILKRILASHRKVVSIPVELRIIVDPNGVLDLKSALTERWSPYKADHAIQRFHRLMLACDSTNLFKRAEVKFLGALGIAPRQYGVIGLGQYFGTRFYRTQLNFLMQKLAYHITRGSWDGTSSYQFPARIYEADYHQQDELNKLLANFIDVLYRQRAQSDSQTHWVDDTPYNLLHVDELMTMFPEMKFIHIYRDPRDVLLSHSKFRWGGDDLVCIARRLSNIMGRWFKIRDWLPNSAYLEVSLEALAATPAIQMNAISDFIGIGPDEGLEHGLAKLHPERVHTGRWQNALSRADLEAILPYLVPVLKAYHYDT